MLSSHLPAAVGLLPALCQDLKRACSAEPFVGPDQAALQRMLSAA